MTKAKDKPALPQAGGSYTRDAKGDLKRVAGTQPKSVDTKTAPPPDVDADKEDN